MKKLRVLVVDDSIFIRRLLLDIINKQSDMEVVGTAINGKEALDKVVALKPDVVSLDIEMPGKNGLIVLQEIMSKRPTPVVMCSTLTKACAEATIVALEIGACDFVAKPTFLANDTLQATAFELVEKLRIASKTRMREVVLTEAPVRMSRVNASKVLLIASSTGGPKALMTLMQSLPKDMKIPAVIAQHMPAGFTTSLAARLDKIGAFRVREAKTGDRLKAGTAYVAPGGSNLRFISSQELDVVPCESLKIPKPNADVLFTSAATHLKDRCIAVILTGMGKDGTAGGKHLREVGSTLFGEDKSTCAVYGMSHSALQAGVTSVEYPIHEIGAAICATLTRGAYAAA